MRATTAGPQTVTLEEQLMLKYSMAIHIKLVGVWDTVGDLGVPWLSFEGITARRCGLSAPGSAGRSSMDFMRWPSTSTGGHFRRHCGR